jgi:signal transduction histidine kinase
LLQIVLAACLLAMAAPSQAAVHYTEAQYVEASGGTFGAVGGLPLPDPAAGWRRVPLPHRLRRGVANGTGARIGTAWFRFDVPADPGWAAGGRLRLYMPRWQTIGQVAVYADGQLLYRSVASPVWNGFNHPLWIPLDGAKAHTPMRILVRIDHLEGAGLALSSLWVGDQHELALRHWVREWLQAELPYLASAAFLVIGLFAFGVWLLRREPAYGLFFATSVLFWLRALHYHLGLEPLPISDSWFGWLTVNSNSWLIPCIYFLGLRLHGQRYPRIEWSLLALIALPTLASLPALAVLPDVASIAPLAYLLMAAALVGMTALAGWSAWRANSRDGLWLASANALNIPGAVHDLLLQTDVLGPEHIYALPYTALTFFGVFLLVVLRRHNAALVASEQANQRLELRLREREAELDASYRSLRAIEHGQVLTRERERLMQDMHDGLGSSLMGALKAVENGHEQDLAGVLRDCLEDLKLAIDSLEPVDADLLLLLAALRYRLGTRLEQAGVRLEWKVEDVPAVPWLDPQSALHILRILQEVLGNAIKHGGAGRLVVATRCQPGSVSVIVEDDGSGFDVDSVASRGRGLANVRRRAHAIDARVHWQSKPGETRFELQLPLGSGQGSPQQPFSGAAGAQSLAPLG